MWKVGNGNDGILGMKTVGDEGRMGGRVRGHGIIFVREHEQRK